MGGGARNDGVSICEKEVEFVDGILQSSRRLWYLGGDTKYYFEDFWY